jgi:subtilisin-like proprotein convertase family protein
MGDAVTTNAGEKITAEKQDGEWVIEVNDYEHYRIPEAVIFGG